MILCANPQAQYKTYKNEINRAVASVLDGGRYILGAETDSFEKEFAAYIGTREAVGVGSGTEALHLALKACGVGPGDEVITVAHTAVATVAAIVLCGAVPVLVDVEKDFFTMAPDQLEKAITAKTKAVVVVHLYGQAADMKSILKITGSRGIKVIEDCAQATGALYAGKRIGSLGDIGCFSFYPTKNLGAIGDGGMVVSGQKELAEKVRTLREYGWDQSRNSQAAGWNSRLDELQAAILRVKLRHLDHDNARRMKIAEFYHKELQDSGIVLPQERPDSDHVYHLYVIQLQERDRLREFLKEKRIQAMVHYPVPVHLQPGYKSAVRVFEKLETTERIAGEILSLPMYPELSESEQKSVMDTVKMFLSSLSSAKANK